MITEQLKQTLGKFLGKKTDNVIENGTTDEGQQVCDLDTGICYTVRTRDGLIERVENSVRINRKVQVESPSGQVKQLLNNTKKEIAYWKKLNGIDCKCKTDAVQPGNYIVDLKGFKEVPNPQQFEKLCYRYDLFRQAAFYCDIVGVKQFWFLAVEKTYPFTVGLYEISEENLNKGREQYEHLLEVHKRSTGDLEDFLYMGTI